jgi:hypothetical protein
MGEVIPLRPDPAGEAHAEEVRRLCWLARIPDQADTYIRRRTAIADVMSDCILAVFGRRLPHDAARHMAQLTGRSGTARHGLPLHPEPHGFRRRPSSFAGSDGPA